ncbi:MAG: S8 family serine peptidase [Myxococcota bacterium]
MDPTHPPTIEAWYPNGGVRLRFPGVDVPLDSVGAALITGRRDRPIPDALRAAGRPIGPWNFVVPVEPGDDALALALRWAADPAVKAAIPDLLLRHTSTAVFDDPEYGGQWYLEELGMDALYDLSLGDPSVRLAVVDSAIDIGHPDLADGVVAPLDVIDGDEDPTPDLDCTGTGCIDEHGTAVSGIAAARANNGVGLVGMCPACSLVPVRMIGELTTLSQDVAAFQHLIDVDAAVVNNSWGYVDPIPAPQALEDIVLDVARDNRGGLGAVVVFAAGNDDRVLLDVELQSLPDVICVSATDRYGLPTNYTNSGDSVDLAAPSATVSLAPGGGITTTFGGTSAAAPVVAGLAGWVLSVQPALSAAEVRQLMVDTAHESSQVTFDANGHHPVYGYGELDPVALLAYLYGGPPTGTDTGPTFHDAVIEGEPPAGCGCTSGGGPGGPVPVWLATAAAALAGRRRRC